MHDRRDRRQHHRNGERKARMIRREEAMRTLMFAVMEAANLRKVELPEATISLRAGKRAACHQR